MNRHIVALFTFLGFFLMTVNADSRGYSRWDCCDCCSKLAAVEPCCESNDFFFGADYLYWTATESDLHYAMSDKEDDSYECFGPMRRNSLCYDWCSGFRLMGGYRWGCDGWDGRAVYTYFHTNGSGSKETSDIKQVYAYWPPSCGANYQADFAKANSSVNYNVLDILFSRTFCISDTLIARPFFGARALWFDQDFHVGYTGGSFAGYKGSIDWETCWAGGGLVFGGETIMKICDCWSWYANGLGGALCGTTESEETIINKAIPTNSSSTSDQKILNEKSCECSCLPCMQFGTGVTFETRFCCYCVTISAGYEMTQWFNLPRMRYYHDNVDRRNATSFVDTGSILIHGLTINGTINF